jgi:predicted dehydrogenase
MSSKTKVRVAAIGAGGMANMMHYPSLTSMPVVDFVGLCDMV